MTNHSKRCNAGGNTTPFNPFTDAVDKIVTTQAIKTWVQWCYFEVMKLKFEDTIWLHDQPCKVIQRQIWRYAMRYKLTSLKFRDEKEYRVLSDQKVDWWFENGQNLSNCSELIIRQHHNESRFVYPTLLGYWIKTLQPCLKQFSSLFHLCMN